MATKIYHRRSSKNGKKIGFMRICLHKWKKVDLKLLLEDFTGLCYNSKSRSEAGKQSPNCKLANNKVDVFSAVNSKTRHMKQEMRSSLVFPQISDNYNITIILLPAASKQR